MEKKKSEQRGQNKEDTITLFAVVRDFVTRHRIALRNFGVTLNKMEFIC
jgi:hypothetical protein